MTNDLNEPYGFTPTRSILWDSSWPESANKADRHKLFAYLNERFGIKETLFDDYLLLKKRKTWFLVKDSTFISSAAKLKVLKIGIKAFEEVGAFIKPTTRLIQSFGNRATKARVDMTKSELIKLTNGEKIAISMDLTNGYVILLHKGRVLGLGLVINGEIRSQLPTKEIRVSMLC
jgi:NOL1/NOP2/fmu family ribosome biogenesis protein